MSLIRNFKSDYFRLFVKREGVVVLGRKCSNLWLLTAVLIATFFAIAFSNGSMEYLDYKMNDPFINWVDIQNQYEEGDFEGLSAALSDPFNADEFHYKDFQSDYKFSYFFFGAEEGITQYLNCRFFGDMNTQLVEAILNEDNVVSSTSISDLSVLSDKTIGVIVTKETMDKLGYESPYPAYIDLYSYSPDADSFGIALDAHNRARTPLPVIGVVKRLPGNVDLISSSFLYSQLTNDSSHPFNLAKEEYGSTLKFYIPEDVDMSSFASAVDAAIRAISDTVRYEIDPYGFYPSEQVNYKFDREQGSFVQIIPSEGNFTFEFASAVAGALLEAYPDADIHRLYSYSDFFTKRKLNEQAYISVHFFDLNKIRDFEEYVGKEFKVKIEMAQINAKENFNAVRLMANILSWAMLAFAIICIILFIVNLLQSYFQKVKRNLGTFKAFGIANNELISVYMLIMIAIVIFSIIVALVVVGSVQALLPVFGVLKDGEFNYLSLWNGMTVCSLLIIVAASMLTVYLVMVDLLKQTPGDLIYDRE